MASIKKNYIFNLINTVSGLLFPLITFPYASRILLAEGIGKVNFLDGIVGYIVLISSLGIPLYGLREVARVRNNMYEKSKVTLEILILNLILTFFAYLIVFVVGTSIQRIHADFALFLLLSSSIIFTTLGVYWFYLGTEDFEYITIRSVSIKILATIALFVFVKDRNDVFWYAAINTGASVGNNIFNIIRLRKKISLNRIRFSDLNIKRHVKPSLKVFTLNMIVSISLQIDTVMLGFMKTDSVVGYYTAASKLTRMSLAVLTSLNSVLMPRFSNYISQGRIDEFKELSGKSIKFIIAMALPMTVGLVLLAHPIISVFSGPDYAPSAPTLQLIAPIILLIGISSFFTMQVLYPMGKENVIIKLAACTSAVNLICNFILIPRFSQFGAAVSSSIAELAGLIAVLIVARKYIRCKIIDKATFNYFIGTVIMAATVILISRLQLKDYQLLLAAVPSGALVYGIYLLIRKDYYIITIKDLVLKQLKGKSS